MEHFKMREARKAAKMTQEELAQLLGINRATLSRYESGAIDPPASQLKAIAKALGVSTAYLTGEIETIHIPMPEYPLSLPTKEQIDRMTQPELEYYHLRLLADDNPDELRKRYTDNYDALNKLGQVEAVIRTKELTRLHEYTDRDTPKEITIQVHSDRPTTAPQSPPAPQEGKDTAPPPDAPETPSEGE